LLAIGEQIRVGIEVSHGKLEDALRARFNDIEIISV
jgi:hypothetical protein